MKVFTTFLLLLSLGFISAEVSDSLFTEIEVEFSNLSDKTQLYGTLSVPHGKGPFPAVLLVNGTAYGDRNGIFDGTHLFGKIAANLAESGFIVLRYDARGFRKNVFDEGYPDFVESKKDALAAYKFLCSQKLTDADKCGLFSYGESSLLSVVLARQLNPAFLINASAYVLGFEDHLLEQAAKNLKAAGTAKESIMKYSDLLHVMLKIIKKEADSTQCQNQLLHLLDNHLPYFSEDEKTMLALHKNEIKSLLEQLNNRRIRSFLQVNPVEVYAQLSCPVLLIFGDEDKLLPIGRSIRMIDQLKNNGNHDNIILVILEQHNHALNKPDVLSEKYSIFEQKLSENVVTKLESFFLHQSIKMK